MTILYIFIHSFRSNFKQTKINSLTISLKHNMFQGNGWGVFLSSPLDIPTLKGFTEIDNDAVKTLNDADKA